MRVSAVQAVGGYRPDLIAGEEPELCVRLREQGGRINRLDAEMTRHDAAMTRFRQWWARNVRAGHAFAEVSRLHSRSSFGIWKRETRSNWVWGILLPTIAIVPAAFTFGLSLLLLLGYPVLYAKVLRSRIDAGRWPHGETLCLLLRLFQVSAGGWPDALLVKPPARKAEPLDRVQGSKGDRMRIAYLTNQYPHVRHTFIRREIVALEAHGAEVLRYSIRDSGSEAVDPADQTEYHKTRAILGAGKVSLLLALVFAAITRPVRFFRASRKAIRFGRRSDRGVVRHMVYLAEACVLRKWLVAANVDHLRPLRDQSGRRRALLQDPLADRPTASPCMARKNGISPTHCPSRKSTKAPGS